MHQVFNEESKRGVYPALIAAARKGDAVQTKALIQQHNIDVNEVSVDILGMLVPIKTTLLCVAIGAKDIEMVKVLLEAGANPLNKSFCGEANGQREDVMLAAECGDFDIAYAVTGASFKFSLIDMTDHGSMEGVRDLLPTLKAEDINFLDRKRDMTPLMVAAFRGHAEIVKILLEAGAKTGIKNSGKRLTALDLATDATTKALLEAQREAEWQEIKARELTLQKPLRLNPPLKFTFTPKDKNLS